MPDIDAAIGAAATGPKSVTTDEGTLTAQSIPEMIQADQYLASKAAAASGSPLKTALRFASPRLPGLP